MTPDELADRLDHAAMKIGPAIQKAVKHTGEMGIARIRGNASGRPGPNVITGAYRNSWRSQTRRLPYGAVCTIGTDLPYGRRLEFGFVGTDSLGRKYNQPPFPHVQPALPYITQTLTAQMRLAIGEVLI
ncbi:HK97 gp10 family phage protein [Streptomyces sp. AD55]|uniref:HK97 gp10 family phage protein n=1 Tax=Streptomyces sp. AD55 TaxID=3242895 RepID=UPI003526EEA4